MRLYFPVKLKKPLNKAACEAMALTMKPVFFRNQNEIARFSHYFQGRNINPPVILNFPVRAV